MPSVNYVLVYCGACGERRKIAPERAYEPRNMGALEWAELRKLECPIPTCRGTMRAAPEYGEPMYCAVGEVMSGKLYSCAPDDDVHIALQTMKEGKVRRLPVITQKGSLVGVISMDDILLRTEPMSLGREPELSSDEVVRTYRAITQRQAPQVVAKQATAA